MAESARYRDFMGRAMSWSAVPERVRGAGDSYGMLDLTVYGRQETREDSPAGWPQR